MSNLRKQFSQVKSNRPVGNLAPVSNRAAVDELGRAFIYTPVDEVERLRKRKVIGTDTRHYSLTNMRTVPELLGDVPRRLLGYVLMLQPHIEYGTNALIRGEGDDTRLKAADFARVWKTQRRTALTNVADLERLSIIFGNADGTYTINERYHFRGKVRDETAEGAVIKTFFTAFKRFDLKPAEWGFVYSLLPLVHYESNVVCADPFEHDPEKVRYLSEKQISEALRMDYRETRRMLKRLRDVRIATSTLLGDSRENLTQMNPFVFFRQAGYPSAALATPFLAEQLAEK
ncbi:hypothetical protein ACQKK5_07905 [Brevibacillus panacihumi]|uniref:hypothetical protein n=1 Tax=Brevibacillus panacihumi TaxID=497735 RepID=UPI003D045BB0